jgi:hypothetical protein
MRQPPVADSRPPVEHLPGLCAPVLADLLGAPVAREQRCHSPLQICPTQLPPPARIPARRTPAIRHQPTPERLSQELLRHLGPARPPPHKDRDVSSNRGPQPGPLRPFAPACFIHVGRGLPLHRGLRLHHRLRDRLDCSGLQLRDRPHAQRGAVQILPAALGGPLRQMIRPRAQGRERLHPRAEAPRRHTRGQRRSRRCTTGRAYHPMDRLLRNDRMHWRNLSALMPLRLRICARQWLLAPPAPLGLDGAPSVHFFDRHPDPCLPLVSWLPTGPAPRGWAPRPVRHSLRRIARRGGATRGASPVAAAPATAGPSPPMPPPWRRARECRPAPLGVCAPKGLVIRTTRFS